MATASLIMLFGLATLFINPYLRGDGVGYYAWLRSPFIDGDLQFENEFRRGDPAFVAGAFDEDGELISSLRTSTGYVRNQWSVGPALLWSPFFAVGHVVSSMRGETADGYSPWELFLVASGSSIYALTGLLLAFRLARRRYGVGPALVATLGIWLASPLPVYAHLLPFWPFACGVFTSGLLLTLWARSPGGSFWKWTGLGFLAGLTAIVHPIGVAWTALPVASIAGLDRGSARERARWITGLITGGMAGIAPQLIARWITEGSPLATGYVGAAWTPLAPDFTRVLFGARHGLLTWTPILILALVGLVRAARQREGRLGRGLLAVFAVMLYAVAAYATPEESSFGNRFFVLFSVGFVIGLASFVEWAWSRRKVLIATIVAAFIVWNALFAFQWAWGLIPKRGPVDWGIVVRNQFTVAPREIIRAGVLFFTDRNELIRIVQQRDLQQLGLSS